MTNSGNYNVVEIEDVDCRDYSTFTHERFLLTVKTLYCSFWHGRPTTILYSNLRVTRTLEERKNNSSYAKIRLSRCSQNKARFDGKICFSHFVRGMRQFDKYRAELREFHHIHTRHFDMMKFGIHFFERQIPYVCVSYMFMMACVMPKNTKFH